MTVTEDAHYSPYDVRHASATVSGEEPLLTPRGTRPVAAQWVRMEWTHGHDEPWLEIGGTPLFKRPRRIRAGGDSIVRRFRPSAYHDTPLPEWITEFYQRHDPNPPQVRTWRRGDVEPPADVTLLRVEDSAAVEGARFLRRTPEDGWWFVDYPNETTDPEGVPWSLVWQDDSDPGTLTEVPVEEQPEVVRQRVLDTEHALSGKVW